MWDQKFSGNTYLYGETPNDFLRENFLTLPGKKILSLGEGEGRNAVFLARHGFEVTALDSSKVGLEKAQMLAKKENVTIQSLLLDLESFEEMPKKFDGIISIFCHVPFLLLQKIIKTTQKNLRSGGIFLMEGYSHGQLAFGTGGPQSLSLLFSPKEVEPLFSDWKLLRFETVQREIHEGSGHNGMSETLQIIAKKI